MKEGWTYKKLGEVAQSELGKTLNSAKDKGSSYPYLCAINVLWDKIDTTTLKETKFEESELERYSVKKGDLLICEGGDIGRAAIWDKDQPILYQNALHRLRFHDALLPRFCLLYLRCLKEKGILDGRYGKGVTIKHLVKSSLLSIPIPVPPLSEQQHIVSELDLLSSIIEKKKAQLKEYDQLAQSIFYDMFGDPVTNEKGWEVKMLGEVGTIITGSTPSTKDDINYSSKDYCFIKPSDISNDNISLISDSEFYISKSAYEKSRKLPKGSVLVTCIGIVGKIGILFKEATCNQQINAIKPNVFTTPFYLAYSLVSLKKILESIAHAPVVPIINKRQFSNIVIPLPPLSLQQSFASKIEAIERQKALIQQSISETETLFNSRMDYYFD
ncbi:MAG: restriction endonuclease subunit S [Bacteroidaceae bacterium]|nr:restriction endonuclease subunit S [Bacteroidaceae bacterium]